MMRTKLPGFTIPELLVSMLISSILMYAIWNIYFFLVTYQGQLSQKSELTFQLAEARFLLTKDFLEADQATSEGSLLSFSSGTDQVHYEIDTSGIVRHHQDHSDTLPLRGYFMLTVTEMTRLVCCFEMPGGTETCLTLEKPTTLGMDDNEADN